MELDNVANEKLYKYMALKLKQGHDKFPPASRHLAQTPFPTDGAARLKKRKSPDAQKVLWSILA